MIVTQVDRHNVQDVVGGDEDVAHGRNAVKQFLGALGLDKEGQEDDAEPKNDQPWRGGGRDAWTVSGCERERERIKFKTCANVSNKNTSSPQLVKLFGCHTGGPLLSDSSPRTGCIPRLDVFLRLEREALY